MCDGIQDNFTMFLRALFGPMFQDAKVVYSQRVMEVESETEDILPAEQGILLSGMVEHD